MRITRGSRLWLAVWMAFSLGFIGCAGETDELDDPITDDMSYMDDGDLAFEEELEAMEADEAIDPTDDVDPYAMGDDLSSDESFDEAIDSLESVEGSDIDSYELDGDSYDAGSVLADETDPVDMDEEPEFETPEPLPAPDGDIASQNDYAPATEESYAATDAAAPNTGAVHYITRPGDTLAGIAGAIYGDRSRWRDLADYNQIADPTRIFPGDQISFPVTSETQSFANQLAQAQMTTVVVQSGDTLSGIAQRELGDGNAWKYIWTFNQDKITNPDRIQVGQVISYLQLGSHTGVASTR